MMKPGCYECKFRGEVLGSAHSRCHHPKVEATKNQMAELFGLLGGGRAMPLPSSASSELNIVADAHGIPSGWFAWPYNFDPVWLENCDGFEEKKPHEPL